MPVIIDRPAAERLDKRIRLLVGSINDNLAKLYELVEEAKHGQVHVALGYPSWPARCAAPLYAPPGAVAVVQSLAMASCAAASGTLPSQTN